MNSSLRDALDGIRAAFPTRALDPTAAFGEGGTTYLSGDDFKAAVVGKTWADLDPAFLEFHHDAAALLAPASFAEYLPAYLTAILEKRPELRNMPGFLRGLLTRGSDPAWFDARADEMTDAQKRAVAHALQALESTSEIEHNKQDLAEALNSYWRDFIDGE